MTESSFISDARRVIECEREALDTISRRLDSDFSRACDAIISCTGRIVVTGTGKSGQIGSKIASTLASTGTPSFFVHSGEASHGDLGMITPDDIVIAISNSGETSEIQTIVPIIKRMEVTLIAMTGSLTSTLARASTFTLNIGVDREACPHNLAPTASTTATLALGDALAVSVLKARNFKKEDFARSHPGGTLGKRLLIYVEDIMHTDDDLPTVSLEATLVDAIAEMSLKRLGMVGVIDAEGLLVGMFTDGDLRRTLSQNINVHESYIKAVMTSSPHNISGNILAVEALEMMQLHSINGLFVVDSNGRPIGALNALDLIRARIL